MTEAATPPVLTWLRLEGLAVAALAALLYWRTGTSWWLFAALWLVPDLSMLGYIANPRIGSYCYNTVHSYLLPIALACLGFLLHHPLLLSLALLWCNHIGVDRALGYGLKYPTGFGITHLKQMGKSKPSIAA
jgi:hypothetical protein